MSRPVADNRDNSAFAKGFVTYRCDLPKFIVTVPRRRDNGLARALYTDSRVDMGL